MDFRYWSFEETERVQFETVEVLYKRVNFRLLHGYDFTLYDMTCMYNISLSINSLQQIAYIRKLVKLRDTRHHTTDNTTVYSTTHGLANLSPQFTLMTCMHAAL